VNIVPSRRVILGVAMSLAASALVVFVWGGGWSELGGALVAALVYGLPILAIEAATEKTVRRWADGSRCPLDWIVYGGAKVVLGLVVARMGTALMLLLGIVRRWQDLYLANRMVIVFLFGSLLNPSRFGGSLKRIATVVVCSVGFPFGYSIPRSHSTRRIATLVWILPLVGFSLLFASDAKHSGLQKASEPFFTFRDHTNVAPLLLTLPTWSALTYSIGALVKSRSKS